MEKSVVCLSCGFDLCYIREAIELGYPAGRTPSRLFSYLNETELPPDDKDHVRGMLLELQKEDTTRIMSSCCVSSLLTAFVPISCERNSNLGNLEREE